MLLAKYFRKPTAQDRLGYDLDQTALVAEFPVTNMVGFVGRLALSTANGPLDGALKHFYNCEACIVLAEPSRTTVIFFGEGETFASMEKEADQYGFYDGHYDHEDLASSLDCLESIDVEDLISRGFKGPFII